MSNKLIIGILALLVILTGGIGYYSFSLNQQLGRMEDRLAESERLQQSGLANVSGQIGGLRAETVTGFTALKEDVEGTQSDVNALGDELAATSERIEENIGDVDSSVAALDTRLSTAEDNLSGISGSNIDAAGLYRKVSQATVRISDGQNTVGSGFILDKEGHVVTAEHVISDLPIIYVITYDGRVFRAATTGVSEASDVAVLKIDSGPGIEPPALADSSLVKIGDPVVAIGAPMGLKDTLTAGIISQVNRAEKIPYDNGSRFISNLFQFDASINFGNSGGPLFNQEGQIIGIVVARVLPNEGDGIDWAVSSNKIKRVAEELITSGTFGYPWVGTSITDLTPKIVQERGLETAGGSLVAEVVTGGPAEIAGVQADDIIMTADGFLIGDTAELTSYLGEKKSPGDALVLEVFRDNRLLTISLTVGERP
jgi:serine protease Do